MRFRDGRRFGGSRRIARGAAAVALCAATTSCIVFGAGAALGTGVGTAAGVASSPDSDHRTSDGMPVGAAIKVTLTPPRDVFAVKDGTSDTTWLRKASSLVGRIDAIHGDTIHLAVTEASVSNGREERFRGGQFVTPVYRTPESSIQVLSVRPGIAEGAAIGLGVGIIAAMVLIIVICTTGGCFN